jgi:acetyl-CoA decarbonylase/synthase complex subunit delta
MERIRTDALAGDSMMAFPMLVNPGYESFRVKETRAPEKDYPDWGNLSFRGAYWEIGTAMSLLAAGADLLILYHPQAVATVKSKIREMFEAKEGV